MHYRVLVPTSGVGTHLGDITKYTNKALVKVGKKPTLSYIIEAYPLDTEFVVTLGYFGQQVRDFIELVYPERKFIFVDVDRYEGPGSSLAYSMLQTKDYLIEPFIYHASDTIITSTPPLPEKNWIAGTRGKGSSHYASFNMRNDRVHRVHDKGMINPDYLHIGLVGVNDTTAFWDQLSQLICEEPHNTSLGDTHVINRMIEHGCHFTPHHVEEWHDTGNVETLTQARQQINDSFHILDKLGESIFMFDTFVVKFFHDEALVDQRVKRGQILQGLVPNIEGSRSNFYRYNYAEGDLYAEVATPNSFHDFLDWSRTHLWKPSQETTPKKFRDVCHDFYYTKSVQRIEKFLSSRDIIDETHVINGETIPSVETIFKEIDWNWLCTAKQTHFHGDFILDNVIKTANGFSLLDWRQNFGGLLQSGDMYYDLAKLNHNLTVNHGMINNNHFNVAIHGSEVQVDIHRKNSLVECQNVLFDFLKETGLDAKKVKVLTGIIWLNMSPLHHHPFDLFLFFHGKRQLWRALHEG